MFYSQFILAKKGPLGTIWIAAHLERKLRKNQVADTDIGLSVDSILFPEVPIALRLSSHLLLGVVRIYSKKVNYLFHDCSEALVKIKQAFRSTIVDLPPEESTAPYHSITLPETFDLDNFELPESALLSSNFVDHHVSTREQITLQDTVNGTSRPTSMFGLDERFGDGDTSHIGLELEQELFMDKHFSPLHASFSIGSKVGVLHGESSLPSTSLGKDGQLSYNEGNCSETPNELSELLCNNHDREGFSSLGGLRRNENASHLYSYSIQTPDLNEVFRPDCQMAPSPYIALTPEEVQTPCLIEPAQGPSTPGLLEEVIPSNFQEIPVLSPQERAATPAEPGRPWRSNDPFMEVEYPEAGNETGHTNAPAMDHSSGGTAEGFASSIVFEQRSGSLGLTHLDENVTIYNSCLPSCTENTIGKSTGNEVKDLSVSDQMQDNREVILPSSVSDETGNLDLHIKLATHSGAEPITSNLSTDNVNKVDASGAIWDAKTTAHNCTEPSNMSYLGHAEDIGSCLSGHTSAIKSDFHLRPCSSKSHQDVTLLEISELSRREQFYSQDIPVSEEAPHICESSLEVQGDDLRSTKFGDSNLEQQQKPGYMFSGVKSGVIEPHQLSMCGLSKVIQPDCFNYSSSSEFREPKKMLAPACNAVFPDDSGQQTADKGVAESDGSVDRISTLSKVIQPDHLIYFSSSEFLEPEKMLAPACNVDFSNDRGLQITDKGVAESEKMLAPACNAVFPDDSGQQTADKGVAKSDGSVDRISTLSKVIQPDHLIYFSSSEFLEPEKMLAPACNVDFPNDRGQQTTDKGVAESDGSVDRISTLYSKKRQVMDITTVQQTDTAAKLSGVLRSWRNDVPDDDDLLASILVGRKSQLLKIGTQLPPSTASSHKRPRTMPKVGMLKRRKVLVDDTMFLHADIIRQQLMNTEDIRRIRKKAPSTRPDIWRIHIYEAEDEIFKNCVLTGVTAELNSLECRRYNLHVNLSAQVKNHNSRANTSEEADSYRTSQFMNEAGAKVLGESVLTPLSVDFVGDKSSLFINGADMEQALEDVKQLVAKEQLEPMSVYHQMDPLNEDPNLMMSEMDAVVRGGSHLSMTVLGESILTPLSLDHVGDNDLLVINGADIEQPHENVKQLAAKEQIEQMSVRLQMEPLNEGPNSFMSEMEAVVWKDSHLRMTETYISENAETCSPLEKHDNESINNSMMSEMEVDAREDFHLIMTETYITENAETCLPLEKPDDASTIVMEKSLHPEGQDRQNTPPDACTIVMEKSLHPEGQDLQNTPLDGLEHITMETTDNSVVEKPDDVSTIVMDKSLHPEGQDRQNTPPDASTIVVEKSLHPEGLDRQNTPLDGLEHVTMETTDNSVVVFMDSECLIHTEGVSNTVDTSSKDNEKNANAVDMENSECSQTCFTYRIDIDGPSGSAQCVAVDSGAELLLEETIGLSVIGEGHNLKILGNEGRPMPDTTCAKIDFMASLSAPTEHVPFTVEENSVAREYNLEAGLHMHANPIDVGAARDSSDFCGAIDDNYAELLNVDDEAEDDAPDSKAAKLLENSGWSVRTRGVAKYLKNLFYEESVHGRKTIAVDRLLFGKTRKEASRMFFETLVLKSRDYIQVEQETPFAYINIKPRIKLLESEF